LALALPSTPASRVEADSLAEVSAVALDTPALAVPDGSGTSLGAGVRQSVRFYGPEPLVAALGAHRMRPLALATADFDEDGVADVACGYEAGGAGAIALFRGNVDSIYPYAPEAQRRRAEGHGTDGAFLARALVTALEDAPELLVAGDFDADGHSDLVAARRGDASLAFVAGTGRGAFGAVRRIALPGLVTALEAGETGRADGVADLVVGISGSSGPAALVLRGDTGAVRAEPSAVAVPEPIAGISIARLAGDHTATIVLAAGSHLVLVRPGGVDEVALAVDATDVSVGRYTQARASIAVLGADGSVSLVDGDALPAAVRRVATAGMSGGELVTARLSASPRDDLVVLEPDARLAIVGGLARQGATTPATGPAIAALAMRLDHDALADLVVLEPASSIPTVLLTRRGAPLTVTNANDDGPGSLRQTIFDAGAQLGGTILFDIPGTGPHRIALESALPAILDPITIDATSQPGYAGSPVVEIDNSAVADDVGLTLAAGASVVRGLSITGATFSGISIFGEGGNIVEANFIGVDPSGRTVKANGGDGVTVTSSSVNVIGGTVAAARNVISGNDVLGIGIEDDSDGNVVAGNYIGVDATGARSAPNGSDGVFLETAPSTTVGGTSAGSRNVISGNGALGVGIFGAGSPGAVVQGNYIGIDATGVVAIPNGGDGVLVEEAPDALVGGTAPGARNVLSGNGLDGVTVLGAGATDAILQGNAIGTNAAETAAVPNGGNGVYLQGPRRTIVGGAAPGAGNVVSGNAALGVALFEGASGTRIMGNRIGLGAGDVPIGNAYDGVYIESSNGNVTGGLGPGEGNTIAYNGAAGVIVFSGVQNTVLANSFFENAWIGIDIDVPGIDGNDAGDVDTGGNTVLNKPVFSGVRADATTTTVRGVYRSAPGSTYTLQFYSSSECDPFGVGEGESFIASADVVTDGAGDAQFEIVLPVVVAFGSVVTATATDTSGNTSEFSECAVVQLAWDPPATEGGPPRNLTITPGDSGPMAGTGGVAGRAPLTGYKVYRSTTQPVQPTPANFFTSVPPTQTNAMAPASSGGFFTVTACYADGTESGGSNDADSPGAPVLGAATLKGASKLLVDGSGFTATVVVIADGLPFVAAAKVKKQRTRVIQKGPLLIQQTLRDYLASKPVGPTGRRQVLVGVRNSTGAVTTILLEL
jgi:hypothetical protein